MRVRGTGSIRQRAGGLFIRFVDAQGNKREESVANTLRRRDVTMRDAERLLRKRMEQVDRLEYLPPEQERATVDEIMGAYFDHLRVVRNERAEHWARTAYHRLAPAVGHIPVGKLKARALEGWHVYAHGKYAPASISQSLAFLRAGLKLAEDRGEIRKAPKIVTPKVHNARKGFIAPATFLELLKHLEDPFDDIARFAYTVPCREQEILGLQWSNVDRATGQLVFERTKNGDDRVLPLEGELGAIIERRWKKRAIGCSFVFHRHGERILSWWDAMRAAFDKVGMEHLVPHQFRQTAVRRLLQAGVREQVVMRIGGWRSRSMLERYAIVDTSDQREAMRMLERSGT